MIEMIIVVVVMGLLAAAIVPRMSGTDARRAKIARDDVVDLLTVLAYRSGVSIEPLGLRYNAEAGTLAMLTLRVDPESGRTTWTADRLANDVVMPHDVRIVSCIVNGELLKQSSWLIECPVEEPRPAFSIRLVGPKLDIVCDLPSHATAPSVRRSDEEADERMEPVDLDQTGRGQEPW